MTKHDCVEITKRSNVTIRENGRRANFKNPGGNVFHLVRVDGCLVTEGIRADWIVRKVDNGSVIVELKGKDVPHACEQIFATYKNASCQDWLERRVAFLVVCSRYPAFDTTIAKIQTRARKMGVRLKAVCGNSDIDFDTLFSG